MELKFLEGLWPQKFLVFWEKKKKKVNLPTLKKRAALQIEIRIFFFLILFARSRSTAFP